MTYGVQRWSCILVSGAVLALAPLGCHEHRPDSAPPASSLPVASPLPASVAAPASPIAPSPPTPPTVAAEPGCAAPLTGGAETTISLGKLLAVRSGSHLTISRKASHGRLTFGVLGPINEDSGANLLALQKYTSFFKTEKVDAIVVTGDAGETPSSIAHVLEPLARTQLPVFIVIGNTECAADYAEGVARAQKQFANIINLNEVRTVSFPEATLVSLPGHHDPNYMHCAKGCRYDTKTVNEVIQAAKEAKSPVILVSHGPPHGDGSQAIDFSPIAGGNVGNPDLQRAIHDGNISFGFFSNIKEAGARATDASGSTVISQDTPVRSLFLNPGPASTDPWAMNNGHSSQGYAATFSLGADGAKWKLFTNPPRSPAEKKHAKELDGTQAEDKH